MITALYSALVCVPLSLEQALLRAAHSAGVRQGYAAIDIKRDLNGRISPLADGLQISIQPGWRSLPSTERQMQMGLAVTQPFRLASFADHRRNQARFEAQALEEGARLNAFERETATTAAWFALWEGWQQVGELARAKQLAEQLLALVTRAVRLGALTGNDEAEARVFLSEAELQRLGAEGDVWERSAALAKAMGEAMTEPIAVTERIPIAPAGIAAKSAFARCHPDALKDRALADAARSKEREEASFRAGRFDVGLAAYYDNPRGLVTFLNFGVELGVFDRGERERGSALAQATLAEARASEAEQSAQTTLTLLEHETRHREEVLAELREHMVPALEQLDKTNERRLSAGDITVFELLQGRRRLLASRTKLRAAEAQLGSAQHAFSRYLLLLDHCVEQRP